MSGLSAKARAVVAAGRDGLRPPAFERARLEALIDSRLAQGAVAPPPSAASSIAAKAYLAIGAAVVGGSTILALSWPGQPPPAPVSTPVAPRVVATPSEPIEPAPVPAPLASQDPVLENAPPSSASAQRSQKDQLAREVALLLRATRALRSGRAAEALEALDEHRRLFPSGLLTVDRRAARAQALCSLQRVSEGRAELARLAPQSPAAARTKQLCDAAQAKREQP